MGTLASEGLTPSPEMKDAVLTALLRAKAEDGHVSAADVRNAVAVLGCSERTVWRWVKQGRLPARERQRWEPNPDYKTMLMRNGGSIADLRESLVNEGKETVSARTMQRIAPRLAVRSVFSNRADT